jgi:hypothetical protein
MGEPSGRGFRRMGDWTTLVESDWGWERKAEKEEMARVDKKGGFERVDSEGWREGAP